MHSIDDIKLYVEPDKDEFDNDIWAFSVEFPSDSPTSKYNPFLTMSGDTGEVIRLTQRANDYPDSHKVIHYTDEAVNLFREDIKKIYGFDIKDLGESLKDNVDIFADGLEPADYINQFDVFKYTGKDKIFRDTITECQEIFKDKNEKIETEKKSFKEAMDEFFDRDEESER